MKRIIEDVEAHYESREVPFGKSYQWHRSTSYLSASAARDSP
jgi:hypothetical protein